MNNISSTESDKFIDKIIVSNSTDPYFNIASEEYFLKNSGDNILLLYINSDSIIAGKHQNILGEINNRYVRENDIKILRRNTGGGTVYHDLGNLNYSFITTAQKGELVNFKKYLEPIISFLKTFGLDACIGSRNEILLDSYKISGTASHVFKNRVIHHGTLLFSSKLDALNQSLLNKSSVYTDKAVKSVKSTVTNISSYLSKAFDIEEFTYLFRSYFHSLYGAPFINFNDLQCSEISQLIENKYNTWEWTYAYSPNYTVTNSFDNRGINLNISLSVNNGRIIDVLLESDTLPYTLIEKLKIALLNEVHSPITIQSCKPLFDNQAISFTEFMDLIF